MAYLAFGVVGVANLVPMGCGMSPQNGSYGVNGEIPRNARYHEVRDFTRRSTRLDRRHQVVRDTTK